MSTESTFPCPSVVRRSVSLETGYARQVKQFYPGCCGGDSILRRRHSSLWFLIALSAWVPFVHFISLQPDFSQDQPKSKLVQHETWSVGLVRSDNVSSQRPLLLIQKPALSSLMLMDAFLSWAVPVAALQQDKIPVENTVSGEVVKLEGATICTCCRCHSAN